MLGSLAERVQSNWVLARSQITESLRFAKKRGSEVQLSVGTVVPAMILITASVWLILDTDLLTWLTHLKHRAQFGRGKSMTGKRVWLIGVRPGDELGEQIALHLMNENVMCLVLSTLHSSKKKSPSKKRSKLDSTLPSKSELQQYLLTLQSDCLSLNPNARVVSCPLSLDSMEQCRREMSVLMDGQVLDAKEMQLKYEKKHSINSFFDFIVFCSPSVVDTSAKSTLAGSTRSLSMRQVMRHSINVRCEGMMDVIRHILDYRAALRAKSQDRPKHGKSKGKKKKSRADDDQSSEVPKRRVSMTQPKSKAGFNLGRMQVGLTASVFGHIKGVPPELRLHSAVSHGILGYFDAWQTQMKEEMIAEDFGVSVICPGLNFTPTKDQMKRRVRRRSSIVSVDIAAAIQEESKRAYGTHLETEEEREKSLIQQGWLISQRVAQVYTSALSNGLSQPWIAGRPILFSAFMERYMPTVGPWLTPYALAYL